MTTLPLMLPCAVSLSCGLLSAGHTFATRLGAVFIIGQGSRPMVSLPKGKGIKLTIIEERSMRQAKGGR